jgi:hypothetical protein
MAGRTSLTVYEGMVGMKENAFINTTFESLAKCRIQHITGTPSV